MKAITMFKLNAAFAALGMFSVAGAAPIDITNYACDNGAGGSGPQHSVISKNDVAFDGQDAFNCYGVFNGNTAPLYEHNGVTVYDSGFDKVDLDFIGKYESSGWKGNGSINFDFSQIGAGVIKFQSTISFDGVWMVHVKQAKCWAGWTFDGSATSGEYVVNWKNGNTCGAIDGDGQTAFSHIGFWGSVAEVPEPASLALLGLGLLGIGAMRRRRLDS